MKAWIQEKRTHAEGFYKRHERIWPVVFFMGGFIFDLCMLDRIDSPMVIGQQTAYLLIIGAMLGQMLREEKTPVKHEGLNWFWRQYYHHRMELMHFLFGTLLNAYTIFYFKSSSLIVSFGFLAFLVGLLVVNEMPQFRSSALPLKFALLSLCTYSFAAYVVPVLVGTVTVRVKDTDYPSVLFFLSLLIGYAPFVFAGWWTQRKSPVLFELLKSAMILPATVVLIVFLGAYFLRIIPPAPLSIQFIGVYHSVEKTSAGYQLGDEKPWWKFWQTGDQEFFAQPGDKVCIFFRLFSPNRFSDQVIIAWFHKDARFGWREEDRIPNKVFGGRVEGFRGLGCKSNYEPGEWRAEVETTDGREIGRIRFSLELTPTQPRTLNYETQ